MSSSRFESLQRALSDPDLRYYVFAVYLLVLCATHPGVTSGVRIWVSLSLMAGLFIPRLFYSSRFWFVVTFTLALNLVDHYQTAANHYWLTVYTALYFMLDTFRKEKGEIAALNVPRALLIITFGVASLQKLLSSYFVSGRLLASYTLQAHSLYSPISKLQDGYDQMVLEFLGTREELASSVPLGGLSVPIQLPFESFPQFFLILTVGVIAIEVGMFAAFSIRKVFEHSVMPLLMLGFVWGTFLFRGEQTFFALLCMLFFLARTELSLKWRLPILLTMAIFIALDVGGIGTVL